MAHTGICMLTGDKFQIFHKYVEDIMGRPIMTHEIGWLEDTIKEKTKTDFIALCADESSSENPNKWIPVSERLPGKGEYGKVLITYIPSGGTLWTTVMIAHYSDLMGIAKPSFHIGEVGKESFQNITEQVTAWMPLPKPYEPQERSRE